MSPHGSGEGEGSTRGRGQAKEEDGKQEYEEEDLEGIDPEDELYATKPTRARKMIAFGWSEGYVSPFLPSPDGLGDRMLSAEGVDAGTIVVDLGSGEGDLLIAATRRGAHAVGFELGEALNETARQRLDGSSFEIIRTDFLSPDLELDAELRRMLGERPSATKLVLAMYLLPDALVKLMPTLRRCFPLCYALVTVKWPLPTDEAAQKAGTSGSGEGWQNYVFPPTPANDGAADGYWAYRGVVAR